MVEINEHTSYARVPTSVLRDKRIPLAVKGMYAVICGCSEDWDYSIQGYEKVLKEGRGAIGRYLKLLEKLGYLSRTYHRGPDGKFLDAKYTALAEPEDASPT